MENNRDSTEIPVKNSQSKQQLKIIVQPGDAQKHMLQALAIKQEQREGGEPSFQFKEIKDEIKNYPQYYSQQYYVPNQGQPSHQGYYYEPGFQGNFYPQYWQNNQMTGFYPYYQQNQVYYQQCGGFGRGHRGRGRHFHHNQFRNQYYQYHPHPPFHGPPPHHQYPNFYPYEGVSYSEASERVVDYPSEPVKSFQGYQLQTNRRTQCHSKRCQRDEGMKSKWKTCKMSRSLSSSSSESESDDASIKMQKKYNSQISEYYRNQMNVFFQKKKINQFQKEKIIKILRNFYPKYDAPINKIIQSVQYLESQNLLFNMRYFKVIKVLLKFNFDMNIAVPKLVSIQQKKNKKVECDLKFQQKYGKEIESMLTHHELIEKQQIDGNNIMPSIKHFRRYFQSRNRRDKIQCQVRLRYFLSFAYSKENIVLFFDEMYPEAQMKEVEAQWLLNATEQQRYRQIQVIYGEGEIADNKIVQKIEELSRNKSEKEVILVSSDQQLFMRCKKIIDLRRTGGRLFFKAAKVASKPALKGKKDQKKMFRSVIKGQIE